MPQIRKFDLELILKPMESKVSSEWIQQLGKYEGSFARIAHFGCANGAETLALMLVLDADEVYGIDRDVYQAKETVKDLKRFISESLMALPIASQDDLSWWKNEVPCFLKEERFPIYIEEIDIAHPSKPYQFSTNYFDLACCSYLLYQILENQDKEDVLFAIEEMKRVAKSGGWIVSDEPDNDSQARFANMFDQAGLERIRVESIENISGKGATTYFYRKIEN